MNASQDVYSVSRLRRGIRHFLFGRVTSALLGLLIFSMVARFLPLEEYGAYAVLLSFVELTLNVSTFGVDWIVIRYLPEYRLHGSRSQLRLFTIKLIGLRLSILVVFGLAGWLLADVIIHALGFTASRNVFLIYLAVMACEGAARFINGNVFESLLCQGYAQIAQVMRNLVFVAGLAYLFLFAGDRSVDGVAVMELAASATSLCISLVMLQRYLANITGSTEVWTPPAMTVMASTARNNYLSYLISLTYSQHTLVLMLSHMASVQVVALYGFARNLMEYVRKYLPAQLFIGLIRPKILASYSQSGSFTTLNRQTQLVYKLSLFVLLAALVVFVAGGEFVIHLIGGQVYIEAKWLVISLLLLLIPFSHRVVLEIVVNTVHLSQLWTKSALCCVMTLPLAWFFMKTSLGVYGIVLALVAAEIFANFLVIYGLKKNGLLYLTDWQGVAKIGGSALVACLMIFVDGLLLQSQVAAVAKMLFCLAVYLLMAYLAKPFRLEERAKINNFAGRKLFVW